MRTNVTFIAVTMLIGSAPALADTLHVPDDYATIQAAIDAAVDGDEVIVSIGTYNEAIDFLGKAIRVASSRGPDWTTIDAAGLDTSVVTCASGEGRDSVLEGFTVSGGSGTVAEDGLSHGGGMYNDRSSPTIRNCTFSDNTISGKGAGIANLSSEPMIVGCKFIRNSITNGNSGGAIACLEGSTCVVTVCTFEDNAGGGVYTVDSDCTVRASRFYENVSSAGGGIYALHSDTRVEDTVFLGNQAFWGGGMQSFRGSAHLQRCTFINNTALNDGGAVRSLSSDVSFIDCTFSGNSAEEGGGLYLSHGNAQFSGCLLTFNIATRVGGGIYASLDTLSIENSTLAGNRSGDSGGGIYANQCTLTDSTLNGNVARGNGGGLSVGGGRILRCVFMDNAAGGLGGAVSTGGYLTVLSACRITGNRAGGSAGVRNAGGVVIMVNSLLSENSAEHSPSTFGNYSDGQMALINCTLFVNPVGDRQAVIENRSGTGSIINSVVWGNGFRSIDDRGESFVVRYCNIEGGYGGERNIDVDPMFLDPAAGDFRFASGSPCIDAADNTAVPRDEFDLDGDGDTEEPIPFDIAGLLRFVDDPDTDDTGQCGDPCVMPIVDMGAYEFQAGAGGCTRNPQWRCDGDVDGDEQVNPVDVGLVQAGFCSGDACTADVLCQYDMDCDGQINPVDAGIVQSLFGTCDAPREVCP